MKTTLLCFFRHGIAMDRGAAGYADKDRPLTQEGKNKTRSAARGLMRMELSFNVVLTSPWLRAKQTAAIVADVLGLPEAGELAALAGDNTALALIDALEPYRGQHVLLVGHEPLLGETVVALLGGKWILDLRKSGACAVEVSALPPSRPATLLWHLTSRQLRWMTP